MPIVPQYQEARVAPNALPNARQSSSASPALFSNGEAQNVIGKSVNVAGNVVGEIAINLQERENADRLFQAETKLKDDYIQYEQQMRERRGSKAYGATTDTQKWFDDQQKKHAEALGNDRQRYLFNQSLIKMRQHAMGTAAAFEDTETRRSTLDSNKASIVGSINMAASAAANGQVMPGSTAENDPVNTARKDITKHIDYMAASEGMLAPVRREMLAQQLTNLHTQVIHSMVDKNPSAARRYFEANKHEINRSADDGIERVLKVGGVKQAAFEFVNELQGMKDLVGEDAYVAAARHEFKDDPDKREAAILEIKTRFNERRAFREAGQKDAADQAWKVYSDTGNLNAVPAATLAGMDGRDVETLRRHAAGKAAGVEVKTNFAVWHDAHARVLRGEAVDLRQYVNDISTPDLKRLTELQTKEPARLDAVSLNQQLSVTHNQMKWGNNDSGKAKKGAFDKAVNDAVNQAQVQSGKKLDQDARQKIIDKMLIEGEVDGSGWLSDSKIFYEVAGKADAAKFQPKISKDDRQTIVERYTRKNGKPPSETDITTIYRTWKGL